MDASGLVKTVVEQHRRFLSARSEWDAQLQDIKRYIAPGLPNFTHESRDGERPTPRLDDTGVRAARRLIDAIHMAVTPPTLPWAQLAWMDPQMDGVWEYRVSRQESEAATQEAFNQSNFQREIGRFWYGYPTAGTSCLYLEDLQNSGRLRFEAYSVNAVSLAEGAEGRIDTVGREYLMTARAIAERWPAAAENPAVKQEIDAKRSDTKFRILHWVGPNDDLAPLRYKSLKYLSLVVLLERGGDALLNAPEGQYQGYEEFPIFVGRYYTMPGETLGRSPAFDCLDDVKVLQRIQYYIDLAIPAAINPPLKDREGNLQRKSGGVDNPTIKPGDYVTFEQPELCTPLIVPANFNAADMALEEKRQAVLDQFFWDELNLRPEKKYMTAFEVQQVRGIANELLAKQISSIKEDVLDPMMERVVNILLRAGKIQLPAAVVTGERPW